MAAVIVSKLCLTWGKKWWMRAQKARPSAQEFVKLEILTFCNRNKLKKGTKVKKQGFPRKMFI